MHLKIKVETRLWSILWNRFHTMQTIQVVIDTTLLKAANRAAKRSKQNRSALIREALREHLRRAEVLAAEKAEREAYLRQPQTEDELAWCAEAVWPEV